MQSGKSAAQTVATVKPLQIRGRTFTAIALHLSGRPDRAFFEALEARLNQTPLFFDNAPLVIDLEQAEGLDRAQDLLHLTAELRRRKLSVFGIQSGTPAQAQAAAEAGLISLPGGRDAALERVSRQGSRPEPAPAPAPKEPANRLIAQPVRSGQTVFADRGDLIVVGSVSSGAEVIAAGNIHIYGRLRGRALAGVNGDDSARIFCHALDAELLAIAGLYRTSENLGADTPRHYVQVYLQGEVLRIESLK
ncbi:septum formation inhibitor MinC (plasmid) [Paracoccus versutus]|uniref:Probable septum site-determining protein MinC n=1 Tax=Paracoccus versutus TaxID=34007 RepID=A0AAQ0HEE3_PARVE|nr:MULTISPECIES: septum site-determining protein MinC [Paracoccus]WGR62069.1 septum formation inhibitor MinC [Paracoccus ferrooxidans]SFY43870.1 septum site-determining protein MinC [Paracoccus pantotrophus]KGJ05297.1 selenocysteine lyase [Paracoccus versutus]MBT0783109.1 septum site-determining protein MinC [Paracoccus sp. pheM1]MCJ1902605.1 septum site-determining protein MinC [Paracoccus versutus]